LSIDGTLDLEQSVDPADGSASGFLGEYCVYQVE